ncbi:YtxH domain-containing protein [Nocardioides ganghwensis]|uniref:YtxH domain-containing protein n=1 Tax=Nocardioides ganghwensis TaxID=252230 RepID=UPI001746E009|nr:YtxH domain-containing protein [Nocardioides ganghwensis]MBD3945907.1 YtxH domain-containing protein [Nocardioides ganghwensis]
MKKLMLLVAGGVGYVLGTRAGRERYEQIKKTAMRVKEDPRVQEKAHQAADVVKETAQQKAPVVKDKVASAASAAADKVTPSGHGGHRSDQSDQSNLEGQLHPDSTARQDNPYPQGDLP